MLGLVTMRLRRTFVRFASVSWSCLVLRFFDREPLIAFWSSRFLCSQGKRKAFDDGSGCWLQAKAAILGSF
jgi:hypothetical protein